jgi:hypothetical protein
VDLLEEYYLLMNMELVNHLQCHHQILQRPLLFVNHDLQYHHHEMLLLKKLN